MHTRSRQLATFVLLTWLLCGALPLVPRAHAQDGTWLRLPATVGVHYHSVIRDPVRDHLIAFGGTGANGNSNDAFLLDLAGAPGWTLVDASAGPRPLERYAQCAVYDPVRDRMLVFGGNTASGVRDDVWALALSGPSLWTQLTPTGTPPAARWGATAIYDPIRDRVIVMGGNTSVARLNDVWELSLSGTPAWTQLAPTGTPPSVRWGHTAIYDAANDRMIMFGGIASIANNQLWALSLAGTPAWTPIAASGVPPAARYAHAAEYDAGNQRMLMFGGYDGTINRNDVWQLTLTGSSAWTSVGASGAPPAVRAGAPWVLDVPRNRLFLFGGLTDAGDRDDLWTLDISGSTQWQAQLPSSAPGASRYSHPAVIDWVGRRMLIIGGFNGSFLDDIRAFDLDGFPHWTTLAPLGTRPSARHSHSATYDLARNRIVVIGGLGSSAGSAGNDVWALSLGATQAWTRLTPTGTPPSLIYGHVAAYDEAHDQIVCYGGSLYSAGSSSPVWTLSLAGTGSWAPLVPGGAASPPNIEGPSGIYDPVRGRLVVFTGGELWELSLGNAPSWKQRPGLTTVRFHSSLAYDPLMDRALAFGGYNSAINATQDVWQFPLGTFTLPTLLAPQGTPPLARTSHSAVFDPLTNQMIVFGGFAAGTQINGDVWALKMPGFGSGTVGAPPTVSGTSLRLAPAYPNPAMSGEVHLEFTLPSPARTTLRVYDVRGRLVRTLIDGTLLAGPQRVRWDRRDGAGLPADAGLYFYDLRSARERRTGRVVLVR